MNPFNPDDPEIGKSDPAIPGADGQDASSETIRLLPLNASESEGKIADVEVILDVRSGSKCGQTTCGNFIAEFTVRLIQYGGTVCMTEVHCGTIMRIQGVAPSIVHEMATCIGTRVATYDALQIVQIQVPAKPLPKEGRNELPSSTYLRTHLSKRVLMILPTGSLVVSNTFNGFREVLGPRETREETWRRAVAYGANGRLFMLYPPDHDDVPSWNDFGHDG